MTNPKEKFFWWIKERYDIYTNKETGQPWPWTDDEILQTYSFTNVFRELDKTTVWLRKHLRDPLCDSPEVIMAVIIFRWFNKIETGENLLGMKRSNQSQPISKFGIFTRWNPGWVDNRLRPHPPWCTGAYMIRSPEGIDKLKGIISNINRLWESREDIIETLEETETIESATRYLTSFPYLGDFMAYEITSDLRHTYVLRDATDIMTWANPGPGAVRGLNRITGRPLKKSMPKGVAIELMRELLGEANDSVNLGYLDFEMRDIEHSLCEFDKYERVYHRQGEPRQKYHRKRT